ncbi:PEP-utilizing enzyme [Sphingobium sp. TB-6]|uniref:PEP-utilizing enzyme n=1 Tax=Sphingobium sp. TB-6 TaxID=2728850 RepID=UPI001F0CE462|nr:PEP-utilizing enzyme [Sphingobium sp. TB-6]
MMGRLYTDRDRYGEAPASLLVEAVHNAVRDLVRKRWSESGDSWASFAFGSSDRLVTKADMEAIERRILGTGYRFAWSSMLSVRDRPDIYAAVEGAIDDPDFSFEHPDAIVAPVDGEGREQRGVGDNVVRCPADTGGIARYIRTSERVIDFMKNGVPEDTIAIIDDSGGTLTAPILEGFKGVICAGGTVRSHLGILTREYGIPCLMNARISGIREGERVLIETSAAARTAESYQSGMEMRARVWKIA